MTRHIQISAIVRTVHSSIIQPYSGILRALCNAWICRNQEYLESWNIQNPSIIAPEVYWESCHIYENRWTLCNAINSEPWHIDNPGRSCVTRAYPEPSHIQNHGIFRTWDIFTTLTRHILAYSERCEALAYWEHCHIWNFAIFRISAYLGLETYSVMIIIITWTFFFFSLILHTFQRNLKRYVFWPQWRQFQSSTEST